MRTVLLGALPWTFLIYFLLILFAYHAMAAGNLTHAEFLAQARLRANHRLVDGDIAEAGLPHRFFTASLATRDDFVGRYVAAKVEKDQPIALETTLTGPKLSAKRGQAIVWISLKDWPDADIAPLDVQRTVDACNIDGDQRCHGPYVIQAIACTTKVPSADTCSAAVAISADERRRLFATVSKGQRAPAVRLVDPAGPPVPRAHGRKTVRR